VTDDRHWVDASAPASTVGVDLERVSRWHEPDPRLFTEAEHAYCLSRQNAAESYAGRWAAKEAVVKAVFPFCPVLPRDVEIVTQDTGAPRVRLRLPSWAAGRVDVAVSISHSDDHAIGIAVARTLGPSPESPSLPRESWKA
jgi:phosphopantetheine--protein transferase-like protein